MPRARKRVRATVRALGQLGVSVRAALVDDGDPAGAIRREITLKQIDGCVVVRKLHGYSCGSAAFSLKDVRVAADPCMATR